MKLPFQVLILIFYNIELSQSKIWEIPISEQLQKCYDQVKSANVDSFVGSAYNWYCEHSSSNVSSLWLDSESLELDSETSEYINHLCETALENDHEDERRKKRQTMWGGCVRKEYRMMSWEERERYHRAVRALKEDRSVQPNKYDAIAGIHTGINNQRAHGGPGFLGWHRLYLLVYETALRQVDASVCIPYWDSTLDNELSNPHLSSMWTDEFVGTPNGAVVSGPFEYFGLPSGGSLMRNVGADSQLMSRSVVNKILSAQSQEDIVSTSSSKLPFNLEFHHGSNHMYIGGTMSRLTTAAYDPIFFMHHAFIDYIWELFRHRISNPTVYPRISTSSLHRASAPTGFRQFTHEYGYSSAVANMTYYQPSPTCNAMNPDCGSEYLECKLPAGRCVPHQQERPNKRSVPDDDEDDDDDGDDDDDDDDDGNDNDDDDDNDDETYSLLTDSGDSIQNDYCIDDTCDISQWALIPIKIINVRPPKLKNYNSYPVRNGHVDYTQDIYSPGAYKQTKMFISNREGNPKTYRNCDKDTPAGLVFLYSHGINYSGFYKEYSIVDQRLPVSVSMGIVAVKKPTAGSVTKALIRAHDSCGRLCDIRCKDPITSKYRDCSGAIALSVDKPAMYGNHMDDAIMSMFDYSGDSSLPSPRLKMDNFFIAFYCDYSKHFPYSS